MILVTGSVTAKPGSFDALRDACLAHCRRSRLEDGCLSHAVRVDTEQADQLVFFEQWRDLPSLHAHFATPGVQELLAAVREHAASSEQITIYEATPLPSVT